MKLTKLFILILLSSSFLLGQRQIKLTDAWGIDIMFSTNGFGIGTFFRHEYSDELSGFIDFSILESKDDQEIEYVDYYGNTYSLGKINRFLVMPLFIGVQHRLFKDDIVDNFRPYISGAVGPAMIYVFPYNEEYFTALGKGKPKYTYGAYICLGSYFGFDKSNILGLNIRYYYIPYPGGLISMQKGTDTISKKQFGGLALSLTFGTAW